MIKMSEVHTKGPWEVSLCEPIYVEDQSGRHLALVFYIDEGLLTKEANAHLMAASPELLKACRIAVDALGCDRVRQERLDAQRIIHAVIKKATEGEGDEF